MKNRGWIIALVILVLVLLFVCLGTLGVLLIAIGGTSMPRVGGPDSVAVIHIEGVIGASSGGGLLGATASVTPENIIQQLQEADQDSRVGAILLRVDSPGGSAAASQEIYDEVKRAKKPVVVSIGDVGASGAYYISSAADEIMASRASSVGSIGVILTVANLEELYKKLGISFTVMTKGKYKDLGGGNRPLTDEEKKILDEQLTTIYDQFIEDVAAGRNMDREKVAELATGLDWPGSQAKELGLVDRLGNYRDALKRAGELGKVKGEPKVVRYDTPSLLQLLSSATSQAANPWREFLRALQGTGAPSEQEIPR